MGGWKKLIKYDDIMEAQKTLVDCWEEDGKRVIEEIYHVAPFNDNVKAFLDHCTACGGNWGGMFLTGIKKLYPNVYNAIPDDMGVSAWGCICRVLLLCGVDTSE